MLVRPQRLFGEQARRHQLDGRVLGAADGDLPLQPRAADNGDAVQSRSFETQ
jgi:hypothetical protein